LEEGRELEREEKDKRRRGREVSFESFGRDKSRVSSWERDNESTRERRRSRREERRRVYAPLQYREDVLLSPFITSSFLTRARLPLLSPLRHHLPPPLPLESKAHILT